MDNRLSPEELVSLSKRGLFAAPHEDRESFLRRVALAPPILPQEYDFSNLKRLYRICPDWVKLIYSDADLRFWEGGCTWEEEGKVVVQLRKHFRMGRKLYGYYEKGELVDHEMVHAVRGALGSVVFEEFLAYKTSLGGLRRWLGPIIRRPWESLVYVATLLPVFIFFAWPRIQLAALFFNLLLLAYGMVRLVRTRKLFLEAQRKAKELLGEEALSFLLHLTDEEIRWCAFAEPAMISQFFYENREANLHCSQIYARFFQ